MCAWFTLTRATGGSLLFRVVAAFSYSGARFLQCPHLKRYNIVINPLLCFFGIEGHVALNRNPGLGYNTQLLRLITVLRSFKCMSLLDSSTHYLAFRLLDSRAARSNSYPNTCVPSREAVCAVFMIVFGTNLPRP